LATAPRATEATGIEAGSTPTEKSCGLASFGSLMPGDLVRGAGDRGISQFGRVDSNPPCAGSRASDVGSSSLWRYSNVAATMVGFEAVDSLDSLRRCALGGCRWLPTGQLGALCSRGLSRFHIKFLNKCIILQLNQFYSAERLLAWFPVIIVALMHLALGAALGWLGGRRLKSPRRELLILTTAFGNCGALPFVLIMPIISNWSVTRATPDAAVETGFGVIGLYLGTWFVVFFTAGKRYVAHMARMTTSAAHGALSKQDGAAVANSSHWVPEQLQTATEASETPSTAAAVLSSSSLRTSACVEDGVSIPTSPSFTAAEASSSTAALRRPAETHRVAPPPRRPLSSRLFSPPLSSLVGTLVGAASEVDAVLYCVLAAVSMGCWSELRTALSAHGSLGWLGDAWQSLGHAGIVLGTVILGAGLWSAYAEARRVQRARSGNGGLVASLRADGDAAAFIGLACVLRLAALPALCMPVHYVATAAGLLPADPTLQMILSLSSGVPSSQTLVMLLNANGAVETAAEASKVYVPMYFLSVLSVSLLIVVQCLLVG